MKSKQKQQAELESRQRYEAAVRLVPFGWEYWDMGVCEVVDGMLGIYRKRVRQGSPEWPFVLWLEAHLDAWENYWVPTDGTGPLKVRDLPEAA